MCVFQFKKKKKRIKEQKENPLMISNFKRIIKNKQINFKYFSFTIHMDKERTKQEERKAFNL